jgi:hypothetical protein
MTAIWRNDGTGWRVLSTAGFPDENALHGLVEEAPQLLPLSGSPRLTVIGREVRLGNGYADLLAVEGTGRLTIIEVKLASNAESRRAIVAQVFTYASYLRGLTREGLEQDVLSAYLRAHGFDSLDAAVSVGSQDGSFDPVEFDNGVRSCLIDGRFRLVLVLDSAPEELVHLVGYLEALGSIVIDLITVSAYQVGEDRLLVPQRVDPERVEATVAAPSSASRPKGQTSKGIEAFATFVDGLPSAKLALVSPLLEWARGMEQRGIARLVSYLSPGGFATLLPYTIGEDVGLVTIVSDGYIQVWRTVFERRAPTSLPLVEAAIAPTPLGQGKAVRPVTDEILNALSAAYEEAAQTHPA